MPILEYDRFSRPLGPGVLTIGSGPEAGWRIISHDLAPVHAMLTLERDGRAHLSRARPDARILINGMAMADSSCVIAAGDSITLGRATMYLRAGRHQDDSIEAAYVRDMSRGRAWRIDDRIDIGRDAACHIHLADPDVSRVHAELAREKNGIVIRPKGGLVFLNGARVVGEMTLREGDEVGVGRTMLRFTRETPLTASVVAPAKDVPRRPSVGDARMLRAQTSYMSVVQAREHFARERYKRWSKAARYVIAALALAIGAFAMSTGKATAKANAKARASTARLR